jgi:hypothetical protein
MSTQNRTDNAAQLDPAPGFKGGREGFALAAALLAMVLIGAVVTGGFYAANQEAAVGRSSIATEEAMMLAEQGLSNVMGTRSPRFLDTLSMTATVNVDVNHAVVSGSDTLGKYTVTARKLGNHLFVLTSTGTAYRSGRLIGATRTVSQLTRTLSVTFPTDRAIMSLGTLHINDNQLVVGTDYVPTGWPGCTNAGTRTGAASPVPIDTRNGTVTGAPPTLIDPSITAASFANFGGISWAQLVAAADKVYAPGATVSAVAPVAVGSTCTTSLISNWGAPTSPTHACYPYMPIIYAQGNLTITAAGSGQGILLVEGDLAGAGNFQFYGVVIVKGRLAPTASTLNVFGTLMVMGGGSMASTSFAGGNTTVTLSTCAVERAMAALPQFERIYPLGQRGWVDLSATGAT